MYFPFAEVLDKWIFKKETEALKKINVKIQINLSLPLKMHWSIERTFLHICSNLYSITVQVILNSNLLQNVSGFYIYIYIYINRFIFIPQIMFTTSLNAIVRNKHFLVNNSITVISLLPSLNQVCYV